MTFSAGPLAFLIVLFSTSVFGQVKTTVRISSGGTDVVNAKVAENLMVFLNAVNVKKEPAATVFSGSGKAAYKELISKAPFQCTENELSLRLIELSGGDFEVRQIPVSVVLPEGNAREELVLQLAPDGRILSVRFAMEQQNMVSVFGESDDLVDLERRQVILQFLELYRTAYNRKDIDYIEKTFSDNAIIIVGQVLKEQKTDNINLEKSSISKENIRFIKYSKTEYIAKLRTATFKQNKYIQVSFSEVSIVRHPKLAQIYGVNLKQRWNSSGYSDEGFLFLMIDFTNDKEPLIHVRSWQPEAFADGSTVNLFDFPIIE